MFKNMLGVLFLIQLLQINRVVCQQNGDVRLNEHGQLNKNNGILEVFLTEVNGWVPVCCDQFNDGAAAAACRQMGYCRHVDSKPGNLHDYSGYSYTNVSCSIHDNYKDYGELHLLRCQGSIQYQKCSQDPVHLTCNETCFIKTDNPYNGQIYLHKGTNLNFNSSGILYLYYDNEWLPVCPRSFKQYAADSACRQLGYTNALYQDGSEKVFSSWDIDTIACKYNSYPCFKSCSDVPSYKQNCESYKITCTFNTANKGSLSSGSKPECAYNTPPTTSPSHNDAGYIVGLVILSVIILVLVITIVIIKRPRCRRNYDPIRENNN